MLEVVDRLSPSTGPHRRHHLQTVCTVHRCRIEPELPQTDHLHPLRPPRRFDWAANGGIDACSHRQLDGVGECLGFDLERHQVRLCHRGEPAKTEPHDAAVGPFPKDRPFQQTVPKVEAPAVSSW